MGDSGAQDADKGLGEDQTLKKRMGLYHPCVRTAMGLLFAQCAHAMCTQCDDIPHAPLRNVRRGQHACSSSSSARMPCSVAQGW
eukprot:CAMPEP_0174312908 /NCGR_PEP_ID=MMETSP0810-20121108/4615_1 /TAXON_ID=73025 ORGANISM="Eutreptiella gymnastica-like, Strain CCMP1594" /NCGR_SAMPLE_ID=MMETSP0810 /ASSEMBLY_ACC=CAM_ASM_000659 /LENGTH=83 /DNA_ID=CAMNT_0015421481 /DNA_START=157 /DNA_END=406 /DNA_ORIENTATION=-